MNSKLFLISLSFTILCDLADSNNGRIYGGNEIDITEAPYIVSITIVIEELDNGTTIVHECGGSILRTNLILTAAHCNVDEEHRQHQYKAEQFYVSVGTNTKELTGGVTHTVKTVFTHPKFQNGDVYHDVGLLELDEDIELNDKAQLVELANREDRPEEGADFIITGYGKNPDAPHSQKLYQVHLNVITAKDCVAELEGGTVEDVDQHLICVQAPGKNQCQGDSGSPILDTSTNRQVGIVSHGASDCSSDSPSALTRVTDNLDYIEEIISKTSPSARSEVSQRGRPVYSFPDFSRDFSRMMDMLSWLTGKMIDFAKGLLTKK
ncbi:Trypsin 3A1 [Pseudolycoriella hygida]|uniref:Trypsin 3A1 n=1 Tax=Pseudolycoriella hygida TaxID=35572 RepID=A0A9Q0NFD0_9DIPT|nr:Trypsin 3A1 [Pseudolycoriella hygida]